MVINCFTDSRIGLVQPIVTKTERVQVVEGTQKEGTLGFDE